MCDNCQVCTLISNDCLSQLTPLKGFDLQLLSDIVNLANTQLEEVTICDLCEGRESDNYQFNEVLDNNKFKTYYSNLIYYNWLKIYGDGKASPEGFRAKSSDEFSEFTVKSSSDILKKASLFKEDTLFSLEKTFKKYFEKAHPSCTECIEIIPRCGCGKSVIQCTCNITEDISDYDTI